MMGVEGWVPNQLECRSLAYAAVDPPAQVGATFVRITPSARYQLERGTPTLPLARSASSRICVFSWPQPVFLQPTTKARKSRDLVRNLVNAAVGGNYNVISMPAGRAENFAEIQARTEDAQRQLDKLDAAARAAVSFVVPRSSSPDDTGDFELLLPKLIDLAKEQEAPLVAQFPMGGQKISKVPSNGSLVRVIGWNSQSVHAFHNKIYDLSAEGELTTPIYEVPPLAGDELRTQSAYAYAACAVGATGVIFPVSSDETGGTFSTRRRQYTLRSYEDAMHMLRRRQYHHANGANPTMASHPKIPDMDATEVHKEVARAIVEHHERLKADLQNGTALAHARQVPWLKPLLPA